MESHLRSRPEPSRKMVVHSLCAGSGSELMAMQVRKSLPPPHPVLHVDDFLQVITIPTSAQEEFEGEIPFQFCEAGSV